MAKIDGFIEFTRKDRELELVEERKKHFNEFLEPIDAQELKNQASRCMDCGIPYCHQGCPVNNVIPDWNDLVYNEDFKTASEILHSTNNFPEFTGRICPAPCEEACTLNIENVPVTIKNIECEIADHAWKKKWIEPKLSKIKTNKNIAIIGSGPAGMAAAQQLARAGHLVEVYEKNLKVGGLLRYGIPDFKMSKNLIDRRVVQMEEEGVVFYTGVHVGKDILLKEMYKKYDAILLTGGSEEPRNIDIPGRDLEGVCFAMDFLTQQNRRIGGEQFKKEKEISAQGKDVVVIGGGDTGSDCIGTSFRQQAKTVTQLEILPVPPEMEEKGITWPNWPHKMRTSSSQAEGAIRDWSVMTKSFVGKSGIVQGLVCVKVDKNLKEIKNSDFTLPANLVLLSMGFLHPVKEGLISDLGAKMDERGNVFANEQNYKTSIDKVFVAGDMRRGQSLVVWAIKEGRRAAYSIDLELMGTSELPF